MPSSISSQVTSPTSLMNMRPVPGWKAKVKGLRSPSAQMARLFPVAVLKNGLSVGMVPSAFTRSIFPRRLASVCALALLAFSPTAT